MPLRLLFFLFLFPLLSIAQKPLKGLVTDASTGRPVPGASVFLSNTSIGTTANGEGRFELGIPAGRYDLVVSSIGYETFSQNLNAASLPDAFTVKLSPKAREMDAVIIRQMEKNGWQTWGTFFKENFIGTSEEGRRSELKNPKALRFYRDKTKGTLDIIATEPLVIENKALGYRIRYQLESFSYEFSSRMLQYTGYPLFEQMEGGAGKQRRWAEARRTVYYGSQLHFMRALFRNRLLEEGFTVLRQRKIPNLQRVRRTERIGNGSIIELDNGTRIRSDVPADTIKAYQSYVGNDPVLNLTAGRPLIGDSIAYAVNNETAGLYFPDYLMVLYDKGVTPPEYQRTVQNGNYRMQSEITLLSGTPVEVNASGLYVNPLDLLSNGWWAWSEKIGTQLPFDYRPDADR